MKGSGILQQAVKINKVKNKKNATHFALINSDSIRYLIAKDNGKRHLCSTITAYSKKLALLMKLLSYVPFFILKWGKIGYYVQAELDSIIFEEYKYLECDAWNLLVGTYDEKQKLVIQCYKMNSEHSTYIKIGNENSEKQMVNEIRFLKKNMNFEYFDIPELITSKCMSNKSSFNILITKEFKGEKVEPILNEDIVSIYREIANVKEVIDGVNYEFSHGDFTPWNIKKNNHKFIVYDWEHCGMRFVGYDLIHYIYMIERLLNNKSIDEAMIIAVTKAKEVEISLRNVSTELLCASYISEVTHTLGHA